MLASQKNKQLEIGAERLVEHYFQNPHHGKKLKVFILLKASQFAKSISKTKQPTITMSATTQFVQSLSKADKFNLLRELQDSMDIFIPYIFARDFMDDHLMENSQEPMTDKQWADVVTSMKYDPRVEDCIHTLADVEADRIAEMMPLDNADAWSDYDDTGIYYDDHTFDADDIGFNEMDCYVREVTGVSLSRNGFIEFYQHLKNMHFYGNIEQLKEQITQFFSIV